jgi:predicted XRE-type DNA-binding protein
MSDELEYTVGSGNVFADLDLPDAEELKAKSDLATEIKQIIEHRRLNDAEAADVMGIDKTKVPSLVRGRLDDFSMERLYRFLNALGRDIEIVVKPTPEGRRRAVLSVKCHAAPAADAIAAEDVRSPAREQSGE